jgi:hypothetical protein
VPDFSSGREALRALQIAANWMMKDWKNSQPPSFGATPNNVLFEINPFPSPKND